MNKPRIIPADEARRLLDDTARDGGHADWYEFDVMVDVIEGSHHVHSETSGSDAALICAAPDLAFTVEQQDAKIKRLQNAIEDWGYRKEMIQDGLLSEEDMQ